MPPPGRAGDPGEERSSGLHVAWLGHRYVNLGDGLHTYSRNVTAALTAKGHSVTFVHHEPTLDDGATSFALAGSPVVQRRLVVSHPGQRRRLEAILRSSAPDVVHLSAPFSTLDFALPRLCRELGLPIVVTFHVPFARNRSLYPTLAAAAYRLYARALAECDGVIVLGMAQRRLLVELGVPERLTTVLPNGVSLVDYSPGPSRARDLFQAERLFTYVGRVDPEKRVGMLVKTFLDASPPPAMRFVVVGDGVDLPRLRRLFRDPRVVFTGPVADECLRIEILRASDAFFLPSQLEAHSFALLEAMACGVAVAATPVGNHAEMLDGAGIVLNPDRLLEDLRSAVAKLIASPELCRVLGARARLRAVELFDLDAHVEGLVAAYRAVIGRGRPASFARSSFLSATAAAHQGAPQMPPFR